MFAQKGQGGTGEVGSWIRREFILWRTKSLCSTVYFLL